MRRTVLISGASISGPALAYWLHRAGFAVTVVEKADAPRDGGYPIDIRGSAVEVVRRMGLLPRLRDAHIDMRRVTFLDPDGGAVASIAPNALAGSVEGRDLEVPRGDLTAILYGAVRDDVEFLFGNSIATLTQTAGGVDVTFRDGRECTFDVVVGADGVHSHTRGLVLGPEEPFHRYLGYCFALFEMPNTFGLAYESVLWSSPGRAAALYAVGDRATVHAFLSFHQPRPPAHDLRDPEARYALVSEVFADAGWQVPGIVDAMRVAPEVFSDTVVQVRLPQWSSGRVALTGDAAYAPSFLTGQGSSLALAGAYMLGRSLAGNPDHRTAFAAYERDFRAFVAVNQALVDSGSAPLFPTTAEALEKRNARLRELVTVPPAPPRPAYSALVVPDFPSGTDARLDR